jgi:hypothetical protein
MVAVPGRKPSCDRLNYDDSALKLFETSTQSSGRAGRRLGTAHKRKAEVSRDRNLRLVTFCGSLSFADIDNLKEWQGSRKYIHAT